MNRYRIVVADSSSTSRKMICDLLKKKGYKTYQASDGAATIRFSRSIYPDLVIIDVNIWGTKAYEVAKVIEEDGLSTVLFIVSNPNQSFYENLKKMKIFAYINKPINRYELYQIVEFSLANSNKINKLREEVQRLEDKLRVRNKIEKAKIFLIKDLDVSEDEAYKILRKKSMDNCISMEEVAERMIQKYS